MGVDKFPVVAILQSVRLHQNGEMHSIQENITICTVYKAVQEHLHKNVVLQWLDMQL